MYGYRYGDPGVHPKIREYGTFNLDVRNQDQLNRGHLRKPVSGLNPNRVAGVCRPKPDFMDPVGIAAGFAHRGAPVVPVIDDYYLARLSATSRLIVESKMRPLDTTEILKSEEHLQGCGKGASFVEARRQDHKKRRRDFDTIVATRQMDAIIKDEYYDSYKMVRPIQTMSPEMAEKDLFSGLSRFIKSTERVAYELPSNVKHTTLLDKLALMRRFKRHGLMISDYSSFEASHRNKVVTAVFRPFYEHAYARFDRKDKIVEAILNLVCGKKNIRFNKRDKLRRIIVSDMESIEMSGDPTTALHNYYYNLVAYVDIYLEKGAELDKIFESLLLEGDDDVNDPLDYTFTTEDFAKRGLIAKITEDLDFEEAGLCQLYFHPELDVVNACPQKKLASSVNIPKKYLYSGHKVHRSLLAAQGRSLLHDHHGAPIVHKWACALMRLTSGQNVRDEHWKTLGYHAHVESVKAMNWRALADEPILMENRLIVERLFGISVAMQYYVEELIDNWKGGELELPLSIFPNLWVQHHQTYVCTNGSSMRANGSESDVDAAMRAWVATLRSPTDHG